MHRKTLDQVRDRFHPLERIKQLPWGQKAALLLDRPVWVRLPSAPHDQVRVKLISHAAYYLTSSGPEAELTATFIDIVNSRSVRAFIDVGANIGLYTWTFLSHVPGGRVIAVEPDPASAALLHATACRWRRSAELHPVALSNVEGVADFHVDTIGGHRSSLVNATSGEVVTVRTRRLDDIVERRQIELIKIDVEGAEENVLAGAQETIERQHPTLIVECFHHPPVCLESLVRLDYEFLDGERGGAATEKTTNYVATVRTSRI